MILRTQLAIGAILFVQGITFGSNFAEANDIDDTRNLRGSELPEQDDRELRPYHFGQGFGLTGNDHRYTSPRLAGMESQRLRPYAPRKALPPPPPKTVKQRPPPPPKTAKMKKTGKTEKYFTQKVGKVGGNVGGKGKKSEKFVNRRPGGALVGPNNRAQPHRGSYLNTMNWQRVPGQPIFVSATNLPTVLILDEPPIVVTDELGNNILVDADGNEIVIETDPEGNLVVSVVVGANTAAPTPTP